MGAAADWKRSGARVKTRVVKRLRSRDAWRKPDPLGRTNEEIRNLEREARVSWETGNKRLGLQQYRTLAATTYPSAERWMTCAQRAMAVGDGHGAAFALQNSLDLDPSNVLAIELLEESVHHLDLQGVSIEDRLGGLSRAYSEGRVSDVDAYDLFTANRFEPGLELLRGSESKDAQELLRLSALSPEETAELIDMAGSLRAEQRTRLIRRLLAFSAASQAVRLADNMDEGEVPVDALRRAIRRALRTGHVRRAQQLLRLFVRIEPDNRWGHGKLAETEAQLQKQDGALSTYQLRRQGFPFPPRKVIPAYKAKRSTVLYALHNALPYNSAGYATRTQGILTALRNSGWDMQGVTRLGYPYDMPGGDAYGELPEVDIVDGVPYYHLSTTPEIPLKKPLQTYVDKYRRSLQWLAKRQEPFVLHAASNHWNGLAAVVAARKLGIPSVYEVRGLWEVTRGSRNPEWAKGGMYKFIAAMEREAANGADRVITITQALADELVARGVDRDKITIVPNGVDVERFREAPRDERLAAELGIEGRTVIGYVGSILDYEGIDMLLDAAEVLKARRDDFVVLLVGDGAEREELEAIASERGLSDCVVFTGRVPHEDVESYYSLIDIAPFPRHALPVCEMVSPLKPLEAMAMGKAVLGSNVRAIEEMIGAGSQTGLLHEKDDLESLVASLETLLNDPALRRTLGENAREWVSSERNWDALTSGISDIYTELGGVPSQVSLEAPTGRASGRMERNGAI